MREQNTIGLAFFFFKKKSYNNLSRSRLMGVCVWGGGGGGGGGGIDLHAGSAVSSVTASGEPARSLLKTASYPAISAKTTSQSSMTMVGSSNPSLLHKPQKHFRI